MSKGGGTNIPANTASTVTNKIDLPDWVNTLGQQNVARAQDLSQQSFSPFPGATVAPINPTQQAGYNAAASVLGSTQPIFNAAIGQVQNLPQTTTSLLNPYLSDVENAAVSNIQRQGAIAGQNLASGAVGQGAFGGTRYGVEQALLNSETQRNIGQTVANIQSQGWNTATDTALKQAAAEAQLAASGQAATLQGAQAAVGAGGAQQTQQQAEIAAAIQQWNQQQNWPYQQLAIAQGALAGTPYGTTTQSTQPYAQNPTANMLGNIGAGLGAISAGSNLFSSNGLFGSNGGLFGSSGLFGSGGPLFGAGLGNAVGSGAALAAGGTGALAALPVGATAADLAAVSSAASAGATGFLPFMAAAA
jgi:hypothetical protein